MKPNTDGEGASWTQPLAGCELGPGQKALTNAGSEKVTALYTGRDPYSKQKQQPKAANANTKRGKSVGKPTPPPSKDEAAAAVKIQAVQRGLVGVSGGFRGYKFSRVCMGYTGHLINAISIVHCKSECWGLFIYC